jgi:diguanylate cyclase (GGDEF)-like protein
MAPAIVLLAAVAVAGIRIAVLHARVRALEAEVITDPLTGAFNRRHLQVVLAAAVERRRRTSERASLVLFDVDRFKDVNDALGHAGGDRVLQALVALIGQRLRKLDALFRIGGEEFVLLLSGARFADALPVAEDLRRLVLDAGLASGQQVTISMGVAELSLNQSVDEWVAEADAALYRAKRGGRNQVAGKRSDASARGAGQPNDNRIPFPARIS